MEVDIDEERKLAQFVNKTPFPLIRVIFIFYRFYAAVHTLGYREKFNFNANKYVVYFLF